MRYYIFFTTFLLMSCSSDDAYISEIEEWRKERIQNLTAPIGWASLAGLHWMSEDTTTIGGPDSKIMYSDDLVGHLGMVLREDSSYVFISSIDGILSDDQPINKIEIKTDRDSLPTRFKYSNWEWTFIERGGKTGLRVWDTAHVNRTHFLELDYFPIDEKYKIEAEFLPFDPPRESSLMNVLGMSIPQKIPGELKFKIDGQELSLLPLDGGPDQFFIIFSDETTAGETYGGGRYLYIPKPGKGSSKCIIDFNKSYTPPCGFTEHATCLLPSKDNTLPVEIRAGEMYLFDH
ncbi:MAG: DUF1684 domain-containing protein [Saprospiraceae bacterium]|nr:DUF1684 domain-containing protein [Saprospiraceae bacterium]